MTTSASTHRATSARWVPYALVALTVVPAISGALRLAGLAGGPQLMPADGRIAAWPLPVVVHILSVIPYAILGAFQFSSRLRRRWPRWHRLTGRVVVALALVVAFSGIWIVLAYPLKPGSGVLLQGFRLAVGTVMAAAAVLGFAAIRRGQVGRHQAWMTRAYALALGAGTQVFTGAFGPMLVGTSVLANDLTMGSAWVINIAVAELVIWRRNTRSARVAVRVAAISGEPRWQPR
ncbi:DUF2306 domain-containing protein [Propionicimonas sp.]|uniref:DUF2306 domain-containing protein n=1 Tax=Propionicimonas sp. TaxID=1955623 RepID=UPI0017D14F9F|nr:DUF2306 domain-containing protein [Propionicimonas sp.]MBU3976100.1 DUF2306 domain-containing protein [Actinomycetota bacterium]MBA3020913.1 DUF2306 domain-containing protein [Propionicimonas sp.]MBU3985290.1 DUF2306 domain-containing protein [Actinomycetota bacterium]MBU4008280.1 DUF2306 domain-containing protein [Actinomycetota bacterium]MBU4064506.1 DUF2306 domain-containing protein [Actinomycetota bacterium]